MPRRLDELGTRECGDCGYSLAALTLFYQRVSEQPKIAHLPLLTGSGPNKHCLYAGSLPLS